MIEANRKPSGPRVLDGVRVLDFTSTIAGPYCTRMMADLGADVLKIEPPGGDILRSVEPIYAGHSALFSALNCGKRSIALDLKAPEAAAIVKQLVHHYDVVVENFSPGVMNRLEIGYDDLVAENEKVIMCSISGFGQTGPDANRPAYAPAVQAWSGFDDITRRAQGDRDRPLNMGLPVADTTASLQALSAINAALFYRERTGEGQYIDISMLDALLGTMAKDFQMSQITGTPDRIYGPIKACDGYVVALPLTDRHFKRLLAVIERPDLIDDPRFSTTLERMRNYAEVTAIAETWSSKITVADATAALEAAGIPCAPYREIGATATDQQLLHRNMMTEIDHPGGSIKAPNTPFLFSKTQAAIRPAVARLGEHNCAVLVGEVGLSDAEYAELTAKNIVIEPAD